MKALFDADEARRAGVSRHLNSESGLGRFDKKSLLLMQKSVKLFLTLLFKKSVRKFVNHP